MKKEEFDEFGKTLVRDFKPLGIGVMSAALHQLGCGEQKSIHIDSKKSTNSDILDTLMYSIFSAGYSAGINNFPLSDSYKTFRQSIVIGLSD